MLTVLVTSERFNAFNALSEDCSLLVVPPHRNLYRVAAILDSFLAHFAILYIPPLAKVFSVALIMLSVICYELIDPNQQAALFVMILELEAG